MRPRLVQGFLEGLLALQGILRLLPLGGRAGVRTRLTPSGSQLLGPKVPEGTPERPLCCGFRLRKHSAWEAPQLNTTVRRLRYPTR